MALAGAEIHDVDAHPGPGPAVEGNGGEPAGGIGDVDVVPPGVAVPQPEGPAP